MWNGVSLTCIYVRHAAGYDLLQAEVITTTAAIAIWAGTKTATDCKISSTVAGAISDVYNSVCEKVSLCFSSAVQTMRG